MPKPQTSEKTKTILDYLSRFPDVMPKDLAERIKEETAFKTVSNDDVSRIKSAYRAQVKAQSEPGPRAVPTPTPAAEAAPVPAQPAPEAQQAPAGNGPPRRQLGVAESVRLVHRLLADIGPRSARDVVDLVAAMGPDEAHRLIDLLQEIDEGPQGAKGSKS